MSLTKEQWECLAVFAGADLLGEFGKDVRGDLYPLRLVGSFTNGWHPNSDWSDFGPLWMKLERWGGKLTLTSQTLAVMYCNFTKARLSGSEQELMQAGCELGAAIGKAMRDGK